MPTYQSAGVYVVEKDLSQVVATTSTSVGAIVLYAKKGKIGTPVLVTNTQEFITNFGTPHSSNGFGAYAAMAFLEQSSQLYVVRVVEGSYAYSGVKASVTITSQRPSATTLAGLTGGTAPDDVTLAATEPFFVYAIGPGAYGNNLKLAITSNNLPVPTATAVASGTGGTLPASAHTYSVTAVNAIGQETTSPTIASVTPTSGQFVTVSIPRLAGASYYKVYRTTGGTTKFITSLPQVSSGSATFIDYGTIAGVTATVPVSMYAVAPTFKLSVYDSTVSNATPVEEYDVALTEMLDGFGQQMYIETRVNTFSKVIRVVLNPAYSSTDSGYGVLSVDATSLSGGNDGDTYSNVSSGAFELGWDLFADPEAITVRLLIEGGTGSSSIQTKMNTIAHSRKDCVAILDVPTAYQEATQAVLYRRSVLNLSSNRAALYTPDLRVNDPYNDVVLYVPPSGHIAGVYAFTDFSSQVWYAPAGLNRGLLNVLGVRHKYSQAQRDILAPSQINYVRNFPGLGIAVWEQTTMQSQTSALSFMNVRRMLDIIEVSVKQALLYSNYEPNDDFLKRQIVTLISQFLEVIKGGRGIADYAVISDTSNNPPQIANQGQLNVDCYIQPILPARVIQLQMIITKQGVSFEELIAQGGV